MKRHCLSRRLCALSTVLFLFVAVAHSQLFPRYENPPLCWAPIWWTPMELPNACMLPSQSPPDSGLYNVSFVGDNQFSPYGYPYHYALIKGISDTLDARVLFYNKQRPFRGYNLEEEKVDQWFAPQIYMNFASGRDPSVLLMDSTQLGFRMRGWGKNGKMVPAPDTLKPTDYGSIVMWFDIWNLPEGRYQVCLLPTDKIPGDFHPIVGGEIVEFYPARDLADSCNGYEGNFWRAVRDGDLTAATQWVEKILEINPTSVPANRLLARNSIYLQDTSAAKDAYDKAIDYLNTGADPAMPDSTKGALREFDRKYIECMQVVLPYERAQLGP